MEISFFFVAAVTLMFLLDKSGSTALSVLAIFLHESAHIVALLCLGGGIKKIGLSLCEFNISAIDSGFSRPCLLFVALSGPLVNVILGLVLMPFWGEFASVSLILGLFQLLPITSLDGDNALEVFSVKRGLRKTLSLLLCFIVAFFGFLLLLHTQYNFSVLAISLYLIFLTLIDR